MKNTNTNRFARLTLAAAMAIGAAVVGLPEASACGGEWFEEVQVDHRPQGLVRAEKDLENGNYDAAAGAVIRMIPHIKAYTKTTKDPIINRAMRVLAVATARKNGQLDIGREIPRVLHTSWLGKDKTERDTNLTWAVATLKVVSESKKNDAVAESELGEAMAKLDSHRAEGKTLLETLAQKDLLTSPQAYKVLGELRKQSGDAQGEAAALDRCREMAKDAKLCGEATGNATS